MPRQSAKPRQLVSRADRTKPTEMKSFKRIREPVIKAVKSTAGTYTTQSRDLPLSKTKQVAQWYVPDYSVDVNRVFQKKIEIYDVPMYHLQDRFNPQTIKKDPHYLERTIAMRNGDTSKRIYTLLPCAPYY